MVNGEAIYQSRPWRVSSDGPTEAQEGSFSDGQAPLYTSQDFRYTMRDGFLYAIQLEPSGRIEELTLPSLAYDLKQPRILHARIQRWNSLEKVSSFLGAKMRQGSIFSYQLAAKQPRVFRLSF